MREISIIKQRILEYLSFKGISKYECYKTTGITNGVLSQNNGISEDNIMRFLSHYSDVNLVWLLLGKDSMLNNEKSVHQEIGSNEASVYYNMYQKKDTEASALKEEVGMLKERIRQLEAKTTEDLNVQQKALEKTM